MNGVAVADDDRYKVVKVDNRFYVIVDTKKERIKECDLVKCYPWQSWGK
tara:strand:- start:436 stop:582 length:147 start_codon:yes stop_codon:yes gene_type:complete